MQLSSNSCLQSPITKSPVPKSSPDLTLSSSPSSKTSQPFNTKNPLRPTKEIAPSKTPGGAVDFTGLQNAVDQLASTSSNKKPGWDRLPANKKQMILHLSSRDEVNPALHPSPDFRELLQQRNSAEAVRLGCTRARIIRSELARQFPFGKSGWRGKVCT